jgi:hypothetical protein
MSVVTLEEARARAISLPADATAAQGVIDGEEAWLARKVGLLVGERTETFYVGLASTRGKLGLARYTDGVIVTDGGADVDASLFRLVDNGSAIHRAYASPSQWWTGPYVTAKYTPNDEAEVRRAIFDLLALAATPTTGYTSETMGSYSYTRPDVGATAAARAIIVASLLPRRDSLVNLSISRRLTHDDPVINRPEPAW